MDKRGKAMKDGHPFYNRFRMLSPKLDHEALKIEKLHTEPLRESISLQEGLLIMASKLIEMCGLLSEVIVSGSHVQMDTCEKLAREVHEQEKILTRDLVESDVKGDLLKGMIRFPYRLERIGDMFESVLSCCRIRTRYGIPFSEKAYVELDQLFTVLVEMMNNLRDALKVPNKAILEASISDGHRVNQMFEEFKLAHWRRLEEGFCAVAASSMYRDILDSLKFINEYLVKMTETLLELASKGPTQRDTRVGDAESTRLEGAESHP
jgi:Na+/phosphate symporter